MKRTTLIVMACLLAAAGVTHAAGTTMNPTKQYPRFQVGASGIWATVEPGLVVTVADTTSGTPADGKVKAGDVIVTAGGRATAVKDPRVPLGEALGAAEAKDGKFVLTIKRGGATKTVTIDIPALGPYSTTWPLKCKKSNAIVKMTCEKLIAGQQAGGYFAGGGGSLSGCLGGLLLLSTGDDAYLPNVQKFAYALARETEANPTGSSWHLGYQLILLGEYYLRTGDAKVLPAMKALSVKAGRSQIAGSWAHSMQNRSVGYVQSGQMNSAGVTVFLGLTVARECGVAEAIEPFNKAMVFFYRMPGHGSICYGDHRAEIYVDTNGRNGAISCAMALLGSGVYDMTAKHLAMLVADSYFAPEAGHTGGGFNIIWRGVNITHLPADQQHRYRRHMQHMAWYYDLARLPGGSFKILPSPATRYSADDWGYAVGLTYTAPRKALRITGAPRSRFSATNRPLPKLPWGTARDKIFLQSDYCAGYGAEEEAPHVIYGKLRAKEAVSVAYAARQMRHFSPMIRTWAAYKLAAIKTDAAYNAIVAALNDPDVRVRRAGCDAISGYTNWGRGKFGLVPRSVVTAKCMASLEKILADPAAALWELDGALWALGCAEPVSIHKNMASIRKFGKHKEWYLRESAYWAVVGLGSNVKEADVMFLAEMYVNSRHVFERSSFDGGMGSLIRANGGDFGPKLTAKYVLKIGQLINNSLIADGYDPGAAHNEATFRLTMTLKRFKNPPYKLLVPEFVKYLATWTPEYQHSGWMITGSGWQKGLCEVAMSLGKDGKPLIDALRKCQAKAPAGGGRRGSKALSIGDLLAKTIADWDKKYGD